MVCIAVDVSPGYEFVHREQALDMGFPSLQDLEERLVDVFVSTSILRAISAAPYRMPP